MFNFRIFLRKFGFSGKENVEIFWKMDSFYKTLNRLKKWNFATVRGAFAPEPPAGARDTL